MDAGLDGNRKPALFVSNQKENVTFSYGKEKVEIDGKTYRCKTGDASVLSDRIDGQKKIREQADCTMERMSKW